VSVPLHLDLLPGKPNGRDLESALQTHYRQASGIEVTTGWPAEPSAKIDAESLNNSDTMELRVFGNAADPAVVLVAKLDNLGKGASGAAVQNLRLMLGERLGAAGAPRSIPSS
jgi:N-acetyl-gamma-glutamyl-phosphate reductase